MKHLFLSIMLAIPAIASAAPRLVDMKFIDLNKVKNKNIVALINEGHSLVLTATKELRIHPIPTTTVTLVGPYGDRQETITRMGDIEIEKEDRRIRIASLSGAILEKGEQFMASVSSDEVVEGKAVLSMFDVDGLPHRELNLMMFSRYKDKSCLRWDQALIITPIGILTLPSIGQCGFNSAPYSVENAKKDLAELGFSIQILK